jgi:hypothetical protein
MYQLVYVSAASTALSDTDLNQILDASRRNNRPRDITGMLLLIDQGFLQVLEGPKQAVLEVFARIGADKRHSALRVLVQHEAPERLFPNWSMGFDKLGPGHTPTADVFAVTREAIQNAVEPARAVEIATLLRTFYKVNADRDAA